MQLHPPGNVALQLQQVHPDMDVMDAKSKPSNARKRATNSCTECRKRRKKCNEARPSCSNCSRRWPAVECIYKHKSLSTRDGLPAPESQASRTSLPILTTTAHTDAARPLTVPSLCTSDSSRSNSTDISEEWHVLESKRAVLDRRRGYDLPANGSEVYTRWMNWTQHRDTKGVKEENFDGAEYVDQPVFVERGVTKMGGIPRSLTYSTYDLLRSRGVQPSRNNIELFEIYNVIAPSIYSIDGSNPKPNLFTKVWQHHGFQSPLMIRSHLFSAAGIRLSQSSLATCNSTLIVTDPIDENGQREINIRSIVALRLEIIGMLNHRLRMKPPNTEDDTIAVLLPFIYEEWMYRQDPSSDSPHVNGLLSIIGMRGGIDKLGMHGLLAKMIIQLAYNLAAASDTEPFLSYNECRHPSLNPPNHPIDPRLTSPLFPFVVSSSINCAIWGVSANTTMVLDEMSYLISGIRFPTSNSNLPTPIQIRNRIFNFPVIRQDTVYETCRLTCRLYCELLIPGTSASPSPISPVTTPSDISVPMKRSPSSDTTELLNYSRYSRPTINSSPDLEDLLNCLKVGSLSQWARMPGVWFWILLVLGSCTAGRPEGTLMRLWQQTCGYALMLADWRVLVENFEGYLGLQRWRRATARGTEREWGILT